MSLYRKNLGKIGENKAEIFLRKNGFSILKKNFRSYGGEIDIIAKKDGTIYFIEVKTRSDTKKGYPWEAVNKRKLLHLKKASQYFILQSRYKDYKLRLGVISIILVGDKEELKFFDDLT